MEIWVFIFVAALLYSSVGHGGASAYLAVAAFMGLNAVSLRPTILALNVLVASISFASFARTGHFSWRLFWPLACASVPFAWLGGTLIIPETIYRRIIGVVLVIAAVQLWRKPAEAHQDAPHELTLLPALGIGSGLGLLSGVTGVGGGIFLSPLLILKRWTDARTTSAVAAPFIIVNSLAGLVALRTNASSISAEFIPWAIAALGGALIGSQLGSKKLSLPGLRRMLAVVLFVASIKLLLT